MRHAQVRRLGSMFAGAVVVIATASLSPVASAHQPAEPGLERVRGDGTFKVMSRNSWRDDVGFNAMVDLKNVTKHWRGKIRIVTQYRNKRGKVVGTDLNFAEALAVRPGARTPVSLWDGRPPKRFARFTLRITSKRTKLRTVKKLKITAGKAYLEHGILNVPVKVRNRNRFKVRHVYVTLTLFNAKGRVLNVDDDGYNYTKPSVLRPGKIGKMTGVFGDHYKNAKRVRIQVEAFRK